MAFKRKNTKRSVAILALLTMLMSMLPMGIFAEAADGLALEPPSFSMAGGSYDQQIQVSITPGVEGGQVFYTLNGNDPVTQGIPYLLPVTISETTVLTAVTKKDNDYSEPAVAVYSIKRNTYQQITALMNLLGKIALLSNGQITTLISLADDWATLDVLTTAQKTLLASNGLTAEDLLTVINVLHGQLDTDAKIDQFRTDIEEYNLDALVDLMDNIKNSFPDSFKDQLAAKGLTLDQVIDAFIDFTKLSFNQGLTITGALKTSVNDILAANGILLAIDQQTLSSNGLNWQNFNTLIEGLTDQEKDNLEVVLSKLGIQVAPPQISPPGGTFSLPVTVSITSVTSGAKVLYTVDSTDPVINGIEYTEPFSLDQTTVLNAVSYKDGVYSAPVHVVFNFSNSFLNRVDEMLDLMHKIALLSNNQFRTIISVLRNWASLNVLSVSQQALLASNGLTSEDLEQVVAVMENHFSTDAEITSFLEDIAEDNLFSLVSLVEEIKNEFPAEFKTELAAKGITIEDLFNVFIDFSQLALNQGLTITSELKSSVHDILQANGIFDAVDQTVFSINGMNWQNVNNMIAGLSDADKLNLEAGLQAMGYITIPDNNSPVASDDTATTNEDTAIEIDVLANDTDVDEDALTVTEVTQGTNGTVATNNGKVTYTPAADFNGEDSFTYTVSDSQGGTATATVTITITAVNDLPVANDDAVATDEDTPVDIDVLDNDYDVDGDQLTITEVGQASHGEAVISNGKITYTPAADYNGTDSFTYTVSDGHGGTATVTVIVAVSVNPVNDAPVANDDTAITDEDTAVEIDVLDNDTDVDQDALTLTEVTQGTNGTVAINNGKVTYTTAANFNGEDSFTYTISDGQGGTATATVTITITAVNDLPVANDDAVATDEDTAIEIDVLDNDSDIDGDQLTITEVGQASHGEAVISNGKITYTPAANYNGTDSFTYTISDGQGGTATATVTITITAVNDLPVANDDAVTTDEDTAVEVDVLANDTDVDGDQLTITEVGQASHGEAVIIDGKITYTPAADYNGIDSFTYIVSDGQGGTATATVTTTITSVNDLPVANDDAVATDEDTAVVIDVLANDYDVDGDLLTITEVGQASHGEAVIIDGKITYTPAADYNGTDSFTYTISDGHGGTATVTVRVAVSVNPINDAPVAVDEAIVTDEDTPVVVDVLDNDSDVDGDQLTITEVGQASHGEAVISNGKITYTPAANYNGEDSFTYTISDGQGGTASATVTVTVTAVNDAPVVVNDVVTIAEDTMVNIDVLDNDSDMDNDLLTVVIVTQGNSGTVVISNNKVNYTPNANFNGTDNFTYTISDGNGGTATATVLVTIVATPMATPGNDTIFYGSQVVTLSSVTPGATIYYTINNEAAQIYDPIEKITLTETTSLQVWSSFQGVNSRTATFNYKLAQYNLSLQTDLDEYFYGIDDVIISGMVTREGYGYPNIDVALNVYTPNGSQLQVEQARTGSDGRFSVTIKPDTIVDAYGGYGKYTIQAQAVGINKTINFTVINGNLPQPVASPPQGTYGRRVAITLTSNVTGADIVYTIGVGDPLTDAGIVYLNPIEWPADTTDLVINAVTVKGRAHSEVITYNYSLAEYTMEIATNFETYRLGIDPVIISGSVKRDGQIYPNTDVALQVNAPDGTEVQVEQPKTGQDGSFEVTIQPATIAENGPGYYTVNAQAAGTTGSVQFYVSQYPPVANDDTATTNEDTAVEIDVLTNDTDVDQDALTVTEVTQGANGTVAINNGKVTYTPAADYNGTDSFTYTISDGQGGTATATVTVTVAAVNDAPVANDDTATSNEDTAVEIDVLANDTDVDQDALTVTEVTQGANGTVAINNGKVTYTPAADFNGEDSFTYTISDSQGGTATATVTITITAVNDLPVANDDTVATDEDTPVDIDVLANDYDIDGDQLTITEVGQASHGEAANIDGKITYTPAANYNGTDSFTYTVSDGHGGTATVTVTVAVSVNPVNDAPVANDDTATINEDTAVDIDVLANDTDVDQDALTVTEVTQGANGTVAINNGKVTYTPAANFNGEDGFTYTVSDGQGGTATANVTVTITAVNDLPVANDDTVATDEDTPIEIDILANDTDVDQVALTVTKVTQGTNGTVAINNGKVTYTPAANYNGTDSFTYTVSDGHGGMATATVTVTVTAVNDAPVAVADTASTVKETAVEINVLNNDRDVDGNQLTVTEVGQPGHGEAVNSNNKITYTPGYDYDGQDSFTYTVSDGHGATATATVTVTVKIVAPPQVSPDEGSYNQPVVVTITPVTSGSIIYYTTDGISDPVNGDMYTGSFTVDHTTVVKAVAEKDGIYSDEIRVTYTINRSTFQRIQDMLALLQKVALLSNDQFRAITAVASKWAALDVLSVDQQNLLAGNGLTADDLVQVVAVVQSQLGTDAQINAFRYNIEHDYFWGLVGLMDEIKNAFPAAFKSELATRGITAEQLIDVFLDFSDLALTQGLVVTSELQSSVHDVLENNGVFNAIDQQTLYNNGLNWVNVNNLIASLTPQEKTGLEAALQTMGLYIPAPVAVPRSGFYTSAQPVRLSSGYGDIYYTTDGSNPTVNATKYDGTTPITIDTTTILRAVAVNNAKQSAVARYVYVIGSVAAPEVSTSGGTYYQPVEVGLSNSTPDAEIFYTLDGSTPNQGSISYGELIHIDVDTTLRAIAYYDNVASIETQQEYVIKPQYDLTVSTDKTDYTIEESVNISGRLTNEGNAYEDVPVSMQVYKPDGSLLEESNLNTGSDGDFEAVAIPDSGGVYRIEVSVVLEDMTYTTSAYFVVIDNTIAAPVSDLQSGIYNSEQTINLSTGTDNAKIYYTTDGSNPAVTTNSKRKEYIVPLRIAPGHHWLLRAVATLDNRYSQMSGYDYEVLAAPQASVSTQILTTPTPVTLSATNKGADIYYTLDNSDPTGDSKIRYTGHITIDRTLTLKAVTAKGGQYSQLYTKDYELLSKPQASVSDTNPLTKPTLVTLTKFNNGAEIYYTIDGKDPTITGGTRILYTGSILVSQSLLLRAVAVKSGQYSQELLLNYQMSTGSISGQITYKGNTVPGINVILGLRSTTTNNNGDYNFNNLLAGNYDMAVSTQKGFSAVNTTLELGEGETKTINFVLLKGGTVIGHLTDTKSGGGIAGIEVNIGDPSEAGETGYWASTITDTDGNFRLEGLQTSANYYLTTWNEQGYIDLGVETKIGPMAVESNKLTVFDAEAADQGLEQARILINNALEQIMDKEEYRVASITGTVKDDLEGTPLGGVYVEAWSDQTGSYASDFSSDGTDGRATGTYNLEGLAPGEGYLITAWSDTGVNKPDASLTNITLVPNTPLEGKDIVVEVARTLTGIVQNSDGEPIAGVQITAYNESTGGGAWAETRVDDPLTTELDEAGTFELQGLPAGSYTVYTWNNLFYEDKEIQEVSTEAGSLTITLLEAGIITGSVVDGNGNGIAGVRVNAWSTTSYGWGSATTNDNDPATPENEAGTFTLRGLADASDYQLDFWKEGYYGKNIQLTAYVQSGEVVTLDQPVLLQGLGESEPAFGNDDTTIKSMQAMVAPGNTIQYRIDYENSSGYQVKNGKLRLKIPAQSTFDSSNRGSWVNGALEVDLPPVLDSGKGGVVTAKVKVNPNVTALQLIAAASVEYKLGDNEDFQQETIGVVATDVVYTNITGPDVSRPGPVTVYGESSKDATIEVWGSKDGGQARKLKQTKADGKWWSATIDFSQTPLLGEGTYQLYAVAVVQGQQSNASQQITLAVESNVPVVKEAIIVEAGWNKNVKSNPRTGFPTMAVAENSPIKVQVKFDTQGSDPEDGSVKLHFLDKVVTMTGSNLVYNGTIPGPWSGFGEEHITLTYQDGTKIYSLVVAEILILIDPSGYVYDLISNELIEGVLAVVEYNTNYNPAESKDQQSKSPNWVRWNAAKYGQVNPQYTDANGRYGWDVPQGQYRVVFSKEDYVSLVSETVTVPPPKTDLNKGLLSVAASLEMKVAPGITDFYPHNLQTGVPINAKITATFSENVVNHNSYQLINDSSDGQIDGNGAVVEGTETYNQITKTIEFTPTAELVSNTVYAVTLDSSAISDDDGNNPPVDYQWSFVTAESSTIASIATNLPVYRNKSNVSISGTLLIDSKEAAGETVVVTVREPDGNDEELAVDPTNELGLFYTSYQPQNSGVYKVKIAYDGKELNFTDFTVLDEPVANISSGTYQGSRNVTLSSSTVGASIFYTMATGGLSPVDPVPDTTGSHYDGPIGVSVGTTKIKALTAVEVNGAWVYSEPVEFTYTVTSPPSQPPSGGPSPSLPPVIKTHEPTLDLDSVNKQLKAGAEEISLQLPADAKEQKAKVSAEALSEITKAGKPVVIQGAQVKLQVPAAILELAKGKDLEITFEQVPESEASKLTDKVETGYQPLGRVVDLAMNTGGQQLQFNQSVTVAISYKDLDLSKVNEGKLGVYWYNDSTGQWEYVGGKINVADQTITFKTFHFSMYAIMEYSKVFTDMTGHWAKEDVELMASKHIINGKTEELFDPESNVTRAEFAALMVRSLGLKGDPQAVLPFKDITADKWYYGEIATAFKEGLVYGNSDTEFAPDASITREQMAVMVMRVLEKAEKGTPASEADVLANLQPFRDNALVSKWALPQTTAAIKLGIVTGRTADQLVPQAFSSRAEAAVILHRMVNKID